MRNVDFRYGRMLINDGILAAGYQEILGAPHIPLQGLLGVPTVRILHHPRAKPQEGKLKLWIKMESVPLRT